MRRRLLLTLLVGACMTSAGAEPIQLRFGTMDYPPFNQDVKGQASGPFADVVEGICRHMDARCSIATLPWRRAIGEVDYNGLSGAFPLLRLPERESRYYFVGPILQATYTIYAHSGNPSTFHTPSDFHGHTIAVYGPSGIEKTLRKMTAGMSDVHIEMEVDTLTVMKKLAAGRYGANGLAFLNRDVAQQLIARDHIAQVQAAGDIETVEYYIGLSRKAVTPDTAAAFDNALNAMKQSGELGAILKKDGFAP